MKLSILDISHTTIGGSPVEAFANSVDLVRHAERLGYQRIWFAEHHEVSASTASSTPEVLVARAAALTDRIRVGSGVVQLNHYSPFKVAETFAVLDAMSPGRIDLVLGPWFAVIGFECDPLAGLSDAELAAVRSFRPRIVKIIESRAGERWRRQRCADPETIVVEDVHNQLRPWFLARGRNVVLVPPNRLVAAMTTTDALGSAVANLAGQFSVSGTDRRG